MIDLKPHWKNIQRVAKIRLASNKTNHHVYRFKNKLEIMGAAGEVAAHLYLGLSPEIHLEFDDGVDLEWRGWTVDVKTARAEIKRLALQIPLRKIKDRLLNSEIYLLTTVDIKKREANIIGYTWRGAILKAKPNYTRPVPCKEIYAWDLYEPSRLKNIRRKRRN